MMKNNLIINFHVLKDVAWFENMILFLKSRYEMTDMAFFENIQDIRKKGFCHITFDDGDKTFYTIAYPVLKKHMVPATLFVSPYIAANHKNFWFQEIRGYDAGIMYGILAGESGLSRDILNKTPYANILKCLPLNRIHEIIAIYQKTTNTQAKPFMNMCAEEILEVENSGLINIGAHTLHHPILKNEDDENCKLEITGSITELENMLSHKIKYFAYPNGIPGMDFGKREISILQDNGITIAVTTANRFLTKNSNKFALPRFGFSHGSIRFIKLKLIAGQHWENIKSMIRPTEYKSRKKILSAIKSKYNVDKIQ